MVGPARFELATTGLENRCSIQLSYGPKKTVLAPKLRASYTMKK